MARSGIRYEEVKDAAETLLSRGLNPTIQRVRELLGTGSNSTISDHLKSWQQQMASAPKTVLPLTIPESVMVALDAFWKIAIQQAEAAFEEQRALARQAVIAAEQARDAALTAQQQAQIEAADLSRQLETAHRTAQELADRWLVEQERRAAAETAIQAAEQRAEAAMDAVTQIRAETAARIAQADTALQQTRADMAQQVVEAQRRFAEERQRGEASEAQWMQRLDQERSERLAERQTALAERQSGLQREAALKQELERLQREQIAMHQHLASVQDNRDQLSTKLTEVQATAEQRQRQYLEADRALEIANVRLDAEIHRREQLEQESREWRRLLLPLQDWLPKSGDSRTS